MDVGVDDAFVVRGDGSGEGIEVEVEKGVFGFEPFGKLAADVEVDVPDVEVLARFPAVSAVTVHEPIHPAQVGGVQAACGGVLKADFGAVFAAELALSGDGVKHLRRPPDLALDDGGVRVQRGGQIVRVLLGDGRDVVDRQVKELEVAVRSELHVVDPLEADVDAQSLGGPAGIDQYSLTVAVGVAVVCVGVVDLADILAHELETALLDLGPVSPTAYILRELQDERVFGNGAARLKAADKTGSQCDAGSRCGPRLNGVVEVDLAIEGPDDPGAVDQPRIKVEALFAHEAFDGHTCCRPQDEPEPIEGIVDAQLPLFIGAQDQPRTELLVEIADRDFEVLLVVVEVAVADARPPEAARIAENGVEVALIAHAC